MENLYTEYAKLSAQIKELDGKKKLIGIEITEKMRENGDKNVRTDDGLFTIGVRKSYKYSDNIKTLEKEYKEAKKQEEENGIAKVTEKEYLLFR